MLYTFSDSIDILERDNGCIIIHRIYDKDDYSIGSIHRSNNCGYFRILSHNKKEYKIEFLKTKNIVTTTKACIQSGKIKDNKLAEVYYIGKKYKTNRGNICTIIEYAGTINSYMMFKVRFDDTGYETISRIGNITRGKIRDPLYPKECNVGYFGLEYNDLRNADKDLYNALYSRWRGMIRRCYCKENSKYSIYGGAGITVDERWHNLSNFIKDSKKLPGFDRDLIIDGILQIDKDKLQGDREPSKKIYSKDTCCWLTSQEQCAYIDYLSASSNQCCKVKCIDPNGNISIEPSIKACARKYNISPPTIKKILNSTNLDYKGFRFKYIDD